MWDLVFFLLRYTFNCIESKGKYYIFMKCIYFPHIPQQMLSQKGFLVRYSLEWSVFWSERKRGKFFSYCSSILAKNETMCYYFIVYYQTCAQNEYYLYDVCRVVSDHSHYISIWVLDLCSWNHCEYHKTIMKFSSVVQEEMNRAMTFRSTVHTISGFHNIANNEGWYSRSRTEALSVRMLVILAVHYKG